MKKKILFFIIPAAAAIVLLVVGILWLSTRKKGLDNSKYFDRGFVDNAVFETVNLINQEDYVTLSAIASEDFREGITENIKSQKSKISEDWGNCTGYGVIHTYEVVRDKEHYAQGTVTATYENVTVSYSLLYDVEMRLVEITME